MNQTTIDAQGFLAHRIMLAASTRDSTALLEIKTETPPSTSRLDGLEVAGRTFSEGASTAAPSPSRRGGSRFAARVAYPLPRGSSVA